MSISVGFIGLGNMGSAILTAWRQKLQNVQSYVVFDIDPAKLKEYKEKKDNSVILVESEVDVVKKSDIIILAVKPNLIKEVCKKIASEVRMKTIVSIAAGIMISEIREVLPDAEIIRIMPNTPLLVGCGTGSITTDKKGKYFDTVFEYFNKTGEFFDLPESLFDAVTGLSGSGPAYIFLILEALADGGVLMGIPRPIAYRLAGNTVLGAAKMLLETKKHPGELKDMITSPKGTTIEALSVLENGGVRGSIMNAVEAATEKSQALRKKN